MKKILVPTDFSDCAMLAVEAAIRLAKTNGSEVHFLHYMSTPEDWLDSPSLYPDVTSKVDLIKEKLQQLMDKAESQGIRAAMEIRYNENADHVIQHVKGNHIDLVIMGSHGSRGMKEFFLGSNAQRVVRYSDVPVLIIKNELYLDDHSSIIFASDFTGSAMHSFLKVLEFAEILKAKIHLLYINMPHTFEDTWTVRDRMESFIFAASSQLAKAEIIDAFDFEEGLARYCQEIGGGIVAMVTHGPRQGLSRVYQLALAEQIVNHVDLPFLSVKV